ncbi:hypothetical protein V8P49_01820 [Acinetobacter baumannii]
MLIYNNQTYIDSSKIESFKANPSFDRTISITMVSGITHKFEYPSKEATEEALRQIKETFDQH